MIPSRVGVPESGLSKFEKFEAPDPAEWTARGYAIANVDARGVYDSEGNIRYVWPCAVLIIYIIPHANKHVAGLVRPRAKTDTMLWRSLQKCLGAMAALGLLVIHGLV
jgi:hypothetical protein